MAPEQQHVEWKPSWRDEHMKLICGFANARGGVLEIGKGRRRKRRRGDRSSPAARGDPRQDAVAARDRVGRESEVGVRPRVSRNRGRAASASDQLQGGVPLLQRQHEAGAQGCRTETIPDCKVRKDLG